MAKPHLGPDSAWCPWAPTQPGVLGLTAQSRRDGAQGQHPQAQATRSSKGPPATSQALPGNLRQNFQAAERGWQETFLPGQCAQKLQVAGWPAVRQSERSARTLRWLVSQRKQASLRLVLSCRRGDWSSTSGLGGRGRDAKRGARPDPEAAGGRVLQAPGRALRPGSRGLREPEPPLVSDPQIQRGPGKADGGWGRGQTDGRGAGRCRPAAPSRVGGLTQCGPRGGRETRNSRAELPAHSLPKATFSFQYILRVFFFRPPLSLISHPPRTGRLRSWRRRLGWRKAAWGSGPIAHPPAGPRWVRLRSRSKWGSGPVTLKAESPLKASSHSGLGSNICTLFYPILQDSCHGPTSTAAGSPWLDSMAHTWFWDWCCFVFSVNFTQKKCSSEINLDPFLSQI